MTIEDYRQAIECKVRGAWSLHKASLEQPLDFFTMLSSISSVVGNEGQANYAAANAFLDAFAHYRKSLRLPANSVDLGAIEDDVRNPINSVSSAQLITGITFPLPNDGSLELTGEARFGYLFSSSSNAVGGDETGNYSEAAADQAVKAFHMMHESGSDVTSLLKASLSLISAQVTKILHLEAEVDAGEPLQTYGLDSLSAVELRGWLRNKLGAELSTLDITNARSLYALCEKIMPQIKEGAC
ncbi:hypothetical protein GQX73_g1748 [Xylaria multiplex]|uniref:Carrier domain-containing protein n=1 Tax=Xylaria multiplex TaxID=323545 RepID=A0A7C8IW65_9PEZI|nr:hypothetical protein GQX73_g1748 [Xylaria multiplex]